MYPRSARMCRRVFIFLYKLIKTSGWIPTAADSRCTWQDNKMCSTSFGPLPVSTVGCEWSVNRVLIVVRRFDLSPSQAKGEQRMLLHLAACPHSAATCQWFLVKSLNSSDSERMDGAASTVHMLHHSVLFPNRMQMLSDTRHAVFQQQIKNI